MADPEYYLNRVKALEFSVSASSVDEAKRVKKQVTQTQKQLRQLKKEINLDMKNIRAHFKERTASAGSTSSGLLSIFGKRKTAGTMRAHAKRGVAKERDNALQPYERLKLHIDNLLLKADAAKDTLDDYIQEG